MNVPLTPLRFLDRARVQFGDKIAVIDGDSRWTYRQYADRCHRLANLQRSWNLPPSSRMAILCYNTHHLLEAYYGIGLAGNVMLPLNIRLLDQDFQFILNDSRARCLFLHSDFLPTVARIRDQLETVEKFVLLDANTGEDWLEPDGYEQLLEAESGELQFELMQVDEDAPAELFYTSGTTDRPKGVVLTHRNLYLHGLNVAVAIKSTENDVQLHTIPLYHVNGWGTPQYLTCAGGTHVMMAKFDPAQVYRFIQQHAVSTFSLVPTMAVALLNLPNRGDYDVSSVRLILLGGAASTPQLVREMEETFGCQCVAGYGLTETSPVLTLALPKNHLELSDDDRYQLQATTGYAIPGAQLAIVDEKNRQLPWDGKTVGEIVVRGDMVMQGYWRRPAETLAAMAQDWFHTGDMAVIDPDGYVLIVDRKKDIIVSGGENISSIEIEKAVLAHSAVLECAVVPVPHEKWGEVATALVVLKPKQKLSQEDLLGHCGAHLAGFKVPHSIEFFEKPLPKGGTGKILKRELREKYWTGQSKRVH